MKSFSVVFIKVSPSLQIKIFVQTFEVCFSHSLLKGNICLSPFQFRVKDIVIFFKFQVWSPALVSFWFWCFNSFNRIQLGLGRLWTTHVSMESSSKVVENNRAKVRWDSNFQTDKHLLVAADDKQQKTAVVTVTSEKEYRKRRNTRVVRDWVCDPEFSSSFCVVDFLC